MEHRFFNHELIDVVTRLQDQGTHVTYATGRSRASLLEEPTISALDLRDPLIIAGGARIIDPTDATPLYETPLPHGLLAQLFPTLAELGIDTAL
jgi:hydroxymethylpyrimidine pyrophosphatase-like HAD family hydrolase